MEWDAGEPLRTEYKVCLDEPGGWSAVLRIPVDKDNQRLVFYSAHHAEPELALAEAHQKAENRFWSLYDAVTRSRYAQRQRFGCCEAEPQETTECDEDQKVAFRSSATCEDGWWSVVLLLEVVVREPDVGVGAVMTKTRFQFDGERHTDLRAAIDDAYGVALLRFGLLHRQLGETPPPSPRGAAAPTSEAPKGEAIDPG